MAALDDDALEVEQLLAAEELKATLDALVIDEVLIERVMDVEGIVSLTLLGHLTEATITSMLKRIMKPARAAAAIHVSNKDESIFQATAYAIGMLQLCGRTAELEDLTPSPIRSWDGILRNRKDFTELTALPKVTELPKSWVKIFDTLKVLLRNRRGETSKHASRT
jgi:hypothetical protein